MNITLLNISSDVRKELSIQDNKTESDNRIEVTLLIGITEINLPHIERWESTKPSYAETHVRSCGRSVFVKIRRKMPFMISIYHLPDCIALVLFWLLLYSLLVESPILLCIYTLPISMLIKVLHWRHIFNLLSRWAIRWLKNVCFDWYNAFEGTDDRLQLFYWSWCFLWNF